MDPRLLERFGWTLIAGGFASGALLGLRFHREEFLGGYASLRRRLLRLGHVALVALGVLSLELARSLPAAAPAWLAPAFAAGALLMPATCFLAAWRAPLRHLFALPVALLGAPVVALLVALAAEGSR